MAWFGRRQAKVPADDVSEDDVPADESDDDEVAVDADDEDGDDEDDAEDAAPLDEWDQLDASRDWRDDGPFDIHEVDLDADEITRVDLGALIITPEPGMTIQLTGPGTADNQPGTVLQLVVSNGPQSAMQVTVYAAPVDENYCGAMRREIIAHSEGATSVECVAGPFGTEIRRILAVKDAEGHDGLVPLRDWLVSGPRWVLDARLMGAAALDQEATGVAAGLEDFFRNIVVRRDEVAMVPGTPIALTVPKQS